MRYYRSRKKTYHHANDGDQEDDLYDPPEDKNESADHRDDLFLSSFLAVI